MSDTSIRKCDRCGNEIRLDTFHMELVLKGDTITEWGAAGGKPKHICGSCFKSIQTMWTER